MRKEQIIAPSLLAANFGKLEEDILRAEHAGADWLHLDIMDGSFVPPITFGTNLVTLCKRTSKLPLDVHLMIANPENHVQSFIDAGASSITFHAEACTDASQLLKSIRSSGAKSGLAINPDTSVDHVLPVLGECDLVLIMTVNPGWGGQSFIESCVAKISQVASEASKQNFNLDIEVDGGINAETAQVCRDAGANVFVAGSYIYGSSDLQQAIDSLRA